MTNILDELKDMEVTPEKRDLGITDISPEDFTLMFMKYMQEFEPKDFEGRTLKILGVDLEKDNLRVFFQFLSEEDAKKERESFN